MSDRKFSATVYMGPNTYYFMVIGARDIIDAARVAVGDCAEANPFWRVVRIAEMSKETEDAPLAIDGD